MMRTKTRGTLAAAALLTASVGLAGCGSDSAETSSEGGNGGGNMSASSAPSMQSESMPSDGMQSDGMQGGQGMDPMADLVGSGCKAYAKAVPSGPGSVQGMAQDNVTTAASNNPMLKTLVQAVSGKVNPKVNLVDALNGGEYTVFAPVDDAFAKIDKKTMTTLTKPAGAKTLESVLTYHVVEGQMTPDEITGKHKTLQGDTVKVTGSGDNLKVDDAKVICGGVHTSNATVYLIDGVLMPKM